MMISPEAFAEGLEGKSCQELRAIKNDLAAATVEFERRRMAFAGDGFVLPGEEPIAPGPDVAYQMNLQYLAETCKKLAEQFIREYEQ
ncbi:MAG: hypothetical protein ACOX1O_04955 [Eggerthellaceae bacterium]